MKNYYVMGTNQNTSINVPETEELFIFLACNDISAVYVGQQLFNKYFTECASCCDMSYLKEARIVDEKGIILVDLIIEGV